MSPDGAGAAGHVILKNTRICGRGLSGDGGRG